MASIYPELDSLEDAFEFEDIPDYEDEEDTFLLDEDIMAYEIEKYPSAEDWAEI